MKLPNLNSLRIFEAVARHGTLQHAADELCLTHGAVSQRIRNLENELQIMLFTRNPRGVSLTHQGKVYAGSVQSALAMLEQATEALRPSEQHLTIHVSPSLASKWLVPRLTGFMRGNPDISVTTKAEEESVGLPLPRNTVAIRHVSDPTASCTAASERIADIRLMALGNLALAPDPSRRVTLEALLAMPLLQDAHRRWDKLLADNNIQQHGRIQTFNRTALALDAAVNGQGIAIAPSLMAQADLCAGRLVVLWHAPCSSGEAFHLIRPKECPPAGPVARFSAWLRAELKERDEPEERDEALKQSALLA
ncbi:MAG: LysR family transcriptional regulator [Alphaproteobacteria bacterium]|nr:LysR family transcriptional regulator [Alphaproteobacteria bacterium]